MNALIRMFNRFFIAVLCLNSGWLVCQNPFTYRNPVDIPILLSGNFGEVRNNHYHAGLDIRTNSQEGLPVYAIAEGFLSRVKVSGSGYGKVVYIQHLNGQVSVYAHLKSFNGNISEYVKHEHFKQEKYEIECFPIADSIKIEAGQIIGFSGNTGSSAGPHLHFEIRDAKKEDVLNPQLYGFSIADNVAPDIKSITFFPLSIGGKVGTSTQPKVYKLSNTNLFLRDTIEVTGQIGIGIEATDRANGSTNANGVFGFAVFMDDKKQFEQKLDAYGFHETKQINALTDFEGKFKGRPKVQKLFAKGCVSFKGIKNGKGILFANDFEAHKFTIIVSDIAGNFREINGWLKFKPLQKTDILLGGKLLACGQPQFYKDNDLNILFPENSLFDTLDFVVSKSGIPFGSITPEYSIGSHHVPLFQPFSLGIKLNNIPEKIRNKLCIAYREPGGNWSTEGGTLRGNEITAKVKRFGNFCVIPDTIPPRITALTDFSKTALKTSSVIQFKVGDNFSGVSSMRVDINGQWLMMEYDSKTMKLFGTLENVKGNPLMAGTHTLTIEVADAVGNSSKLTKKIRIL